jgi:hypothetical protein
MGTSAPGQSSSCPLHSSPWLQQRLRQSQLAHSPQCSLPPPKAAPTTVQACFLGSVPHCREQTPSKLYQEFHMSACTHTHTHTYMFGQSPRVVAPRLDSPSSFSVSGLFHTPVLSCLWIDPFPVALFCHLSIHSTQALSACSGSSHRNRARWGPCP